MMSAAVAPAEGSGAFKRPRDERPPGTTSADIIPPKRGGDVVRLKNDFICPLPFTNTLPPPPVEYKLLKEGVELAALTAQALAPGLEALHRWEVPAEGTLGIGVDLVLDLAAGGCAGAYALRPELLASNEARTDAGLLGSTAHLAPEDAALLGPVPGLDTPGAAGGSAPLSAKAAAVTAGLGTRRPGGGLGELHVPWLRRHVYLGNDLYAEKNRKAAADNAAAEFARAAEQVAREEAAEPGGQLSTSVHAHSLSAQIDAIEASFEAVATACDGELGPKHPLHPELTAVSVCPLLPDAECWPNIYTYVRFDGDPAVATLGGGDGEGGSAGADRAQLERAIAKGFGVPGREGSSFLAYLLPAQPHPPAAAGADDAPCAAERFEWVREYSHDVKRTERDSFLFVLGADGRSASYNELSARIELTRRSVAERVQSGINALRPATITLSRRDESAEEAQSRAARKQIVSGPGRELLEFRPSAAAPTEPMAARAASGEAGAGGAAGRQAGEAEGGAAAEGEGAGAGE